MIDYYKILEIEQSATDLEIKKAYRRLALKFHPDKNKGDKYAEEKFITILEAYKTLSDFEKRRNYDHNYKKQPNNHRYSNTEKKTEYKLTPEILLSKLKTSTYYALLSVNGLSSRKFLFDTIDSFLTEERIDFLYKSGDIKTNKEIIKEVLEYCKHLRYEKHPVHSFIYLEKISLKLVRLAGTDNELINKIYKFSKQKKLYRHWDKYKTSSTYLMVALFFIAIFYFAPDSSNLPSDNRPTNGDLNNTFNQTKQTNQEQEFQDRKDSLISDGWEEQSVENGQLSSCYNFNPKIGNIDNYLEIVVGGGTDVAIKVMDIKTDKCIRYVFINSGSTYKIQNIPEGQYYLKIAYGKNWLSKIINGQCIGRFIRNPIYEKGEKILDYNLKHDAEGYKAPSFRVSLDVIGSSQSNSFDSAKISENEFNQ